MIRKTWVCMALAVLLVASCWKGHTGTEESMQDSTWVEDTLMSDSVAEVEEEMDEAVEENRVDGSFDDFIFTFTRLPHLQAQRTDFPLPLITAEGEETTVSNRHEVGDFGFLEGDYYTVLYGSMRELEAEHDGTDSLVRVDRVDLESLSMRTYTFERLNGKWHLTRLHDRMFGEDILSDFYRFYARFSSDSTFQAQSVAPSAWMPNVLYGSKEQFSLIIMISTSLRVYIQLSPHYIPVSLRNSSGAILRRRDGRQTPPAAQCPCHTSASQCAGWCSAGCSGYWR